MSKFCIYCNASFKFGSIGGSGNHLCNVSFNSSGVIFAGAVVLTCENFFQNVYFIPVSALGVTPERDQKNVIGIKPANIKPIWAEVPFLLQLWLAGQLEAVDTASNADSEKITDYRFTENNMIFSSSSGTRETLPLNYAGYTVYSNKRGKYITLPELEQRIKDKNDDNFWENLEG